MSTSCCRTLTWALFSSVQETRAKEPSGALDLRIARYTFSDLGSVGEVVPPHSALGVFISVSLIPGTAHPAGLNASTTRPSAHILLIPSGADCAKSTIGKKKAAQTKLRTIRFTVSMVTEVNRQPIGGSRRYFTISVVNRRSRKCALLFRLFQRINNRLLFREVHSASQGDL